jgi:hypothetical protein
VNPVGSPVCIAGWAAAAVLKGRFFYTIAAFRLVGGRWRLAASGYAPACYLIPVAVVAVHAECLAWDDSTQPTPAGKVLDRLWAAARALHPPKPYEAPVGWTSQIVDVGSCWVPDPNYRWENRPCRDAGESLHNSYVSELKTSLKALLVHCRPHRPSAAHRAEAVLVTRDGKFACLRNE